MNAGYDCNRQLKCFFSSRKDYTTLKLSLLPATETFVFDTNKALKLNSVTANSNSFDKSTFLMRQKLIVIFSHKI